MSVVPSSSEICVVTNLVVKQLYTDVQLLSSLFQKAYGKVVYRVQLLKMLNVSERPRTGVVPSSSKFAPANL